MDLASNGPCDSKNSRVRDVASNGPCDSQAARVSDVTSKGPCDSQAARVRDVASNGPSSFQYACAGPISLSDTNGSADTPYANNNVSNMARTAILDMVETVFLVYHIDWYSGKQDQDGERAGNKYPQHSLI